MLKWVFPKLSNEIPCLTPLYIGTLIERAKEKSIPYKDTGKKKLTPLEDGQKAKAFHLQDWAKLNFKFHFTVVGGIQTDRDNMTNTSNVTNIHNGHEFVDLGLPSGLLWATCNVGATSPEKAGLYFEWGETTGYTTEQIIAGEKYFEYKTSNIRSFKHNLTLEQDAAHAYMGGNWRMPTNAEFQELIDNCTTNYILNYNGTGVKGYLFTSKTNGKSIFFPAAGNCDDYLVLLAGSLGNYWTSTLGSETSSYSLCLYGSSIGVSNYEWFWGQTVRGVCK